MNRREFNRRLLLFAAAAVVPRARAVASAPAANPLTAVDTHAHVFLCTLTFAPGRRYTPDYDATSERYLALLDQHGLSHGVLIQPSFLGTDNRFLLDALRKHPRRLRGVAVVEPGVSGAALGELAAAGIVGLRLDLFGLPIPDLRAPPWPALFGRIARLGWQVEIHCEAKDLAAIVGPLLDAGVNVVVDHFGRPDPKLGVDDPGFRYLLTTAPSRRVWVKLSAAYRNGADGRGEEIARAAAPLLRAAFGAERLLWASDWPHTQFESATRFAASRALLDIWIPSPAERAAILGATPAQLFRFDTP